MTPVVFAAAGRTPPASLAILAGERHRDERRECRVILQKAAHWNPSTR
jgi:hypothetical protein